MSIANSAKDRVSPCFITCLHILHIHAYLDTTTYTTIQQLTSAGSSIRVGLIVHCIVGQRTWAKPKVWFLKRRTTRAVLHMGLFLLEKSGQSRTHPLSQDNMCASWSWLHQFAGNTLQRAMWTSPRSRSGDSWPCRTWTLAVSASFTAII